MTTRDTRGDGDPDDWFDEPAAPDPWTAQSPDVDRMLRDAEDWTSDVGDTGAINREPRRLPSPQVMAVVGLALAALLGVLAAAGVFSGGRRAALPLPAARQTQPTQTTQTTPTSTQSQSPVVPTTPLKPGSSGPEVRKLQHALALVGDSPGTIDGSYGNATTQAVTRFQQAHGLAADGIAGAKTLAALANALQTG